MRPKYSIIIGAYNQLENLTKPCLQSITRNTNFDLTEIIVVSNGCTDGTAEYVKSLSGPFRSLDFKDPLGYAKAYNIGINESDGEYVVLLNNDCTIMNPAWLRVMQLPFIEAQNIGITGYKKKFDDYTEYDFLIFFCVMMRRSIFEEIGLLDENFPVGAGEDTDFCVRVQREGYSLVQVPDPNDHKAGREYILHEGGSTVKLVPDWGKTWINNMNKVKAKWENQ